MKLTSKEYNQMSKSASPKTKSIVTVPSAFLVGGLICVLGQLLTVGYQELGLPKDNASALTSVTLIFLSAVLTGLHIYDTIAKFGGAGTLVPITGFANAVVSPALEFRSEGLILGLGAKLFVIAGPVIVYGITTSVLYGVIIFLFKLY